MIDLEHNAPLPRVLHVGCRIAVSELLQAYDPELFVDHHLAAIRREFLAALEQLKKHPNGR